MAQSQSSFSPETHNRLLQSAGEVFAEKGFGVATIREICQRAGANIAAVNYHFGDKRELYLAVIKASQLCADVQHPSLVSEAALPEERLLDFNERFLRSLLDSGRPSWHGKLLAREMAEPTGALEELVRDQMKPKSMVLSSIVDALVGELPHDVTFRCVASIIGQMLHYHFARQVMKIMNPRLADIENHVPEIAHHITQFSIGGIRAIAAEHRKAKP